MLEIDADNRITAEQALAHPYLQQYADPTDEPSSLPYDQTFEDLDLSVEEWKSIARDIHNSSLDYFTLSLFRICLGRSSKFQATLKPYKNFI